MILPESSTAALLLCHCPDLPCDGPALAARLTQEGVAVSPAPPLCTPAGLRQLHAWLASTAAPRLVAACGPERHAGFFQRLAGAAPLTVIDLLSQENLEAAAGAVTLALSLPPEPAPQCPPAIREALVVGGGPAGCQAALDLAQAGLKVYLAESSLSIGGAMAQLDKTFPTLDCSICILGPKLVEVAAHPRIELLTYATLEEITGAAGHFEAAFTLAPRYVDMGKCVGCDSCTAVCPVLVPSRWNLGLKARKCIRIVFAQAVPLRATVEKEFCIDCGMCVKTCERQAIDLTHQPQTRRLTVGAVILATGAKPFDPTLKGEYGYGRLPGVVTNLEFERIVCVTGPTQGNLITPRGEPVRRVAFIQCVGSRDRRFLPYCSGYCCTASVKEAMLALEHGVQEVTVFYNDLRTAGKGYEELYRRARRAGVRFIKGLPGRLDEDAAGSPVIFFEDQETGRRGRLTVDLAVLAVGLKAPAAALPFAEHAPARDAQGFYQGRHPVLHPLQSSVPGVFLAGTCHGPRDITESVSQGSAAALLVIKMLSGHHRQAD